MSNPLPIPFVSDDYTLYVSQSRFPSELMTRIHIRIKNTNSEVVESTVTEFSTDKISMAEHLVLVAKKVLDEINLQIKDNEISAKQNDSDVIEIGTDKSNGLEIIY